MILKDFFEELKSNPKMALLILVVIVALMLGFVLGRKSAPVKIQEKVVEKVVEHVKTVTVQVDNKDTQENQKKDTHIVVITVKKPDGTTITKTVNDTHSQDQKHTVEVKYVDRVVEKTVEKKVEVTKTIERVLPQWQVSARFGTTLTQLKPSVTPPYFQPILVGAEVDRRILGPVFLGIWGTTDLKLQAVSAGLSLQFQF